MGNDPDAKLKTFALMIKFSHDLFDCRDLKSTASAAVNNSYALLSFRSSALYRLGEDGSCNVLGQYGQIAVHEHASAVLLQKKLIREAVFDRNNTAVIGKDQLPEELSGSDSVYLLCKLSYPASVQKKGSFVWLLEFEKELPEQTVTAARLLGKSIAEALALAEISSAEVPFWKRIPFCSGKGRKIAAGVLLLIGVLCIPVRESATAEFMLKSPEITAAYAVFDGTVERCLKQDGDRVRKGELIAEFDTAELDYRLANANAALKEVETDLDLARQEAFTDESKLGRVKLLKAKCDILRVAVKEASWYLKRSQIRARSAGILALTENRTGQLAGKAVRAGEKLFEIYGGSTLIAEVMVHERDSSVLQKSLEVELFLHTAPEKGIRGEVISISGYPVLNERKLYCYPVRVQLKDPARKDLRFGMRGIAKVSGGKVSLGYMLFKNLILSFRHW